VVVADQNASAAGEAAQEAAKLSSAEMVQSAALDLTSRATIDAAVRAAVLQFGGFDSVINTAAIFPTPKPGTPPEETWALTMSLNVTSNFVLAQEAAKVLQAQNLPASIVLTGSANAVVPKAGSEAYDVSKAAINHLVRELAIGLGPLVRVNGNRPGDGDRGVGDVPARTGDRVAAEDTDRVRRLGVDRGPARQAGGVSTRSGRSRAADPADRQRQRDLLPRGTEREDTGHIIRWMGACRRRFCG
jgi:NAD(P)-dependent dehydrogenase (short-subunit alcohol dehydrogenase family)